MSSDSENERPANGEMKDIYSRSPRSRSGSNQSRSVTPELKKGVDNGERELNMKRSITKSRSKSPAKSRSMSASRSPKRSRSPSLQRSRSRSLSRKRSMSRSLSRKRFRSRSRSRKRSRSPKRRRRSRSRSPRRRSRSRGRRSRSRSRRRRRRRSRTRSRTPIDGARLHVAELDSDTSKRDLEKLFEKYGRIKEVWMAHNPPCFAFVVFERQKDADDAMRLTNGLQFGHSRLRVTMARPRTRGWRTRSGYDPNLRCYQCGELGHFSRNCTDTRFGYKRPPSPHGRQRRRRSRSRSRSRS